MNGQWREVATLRFKGERFRDHALDLSAVTELRQFQKMVAETAKALWHAAHPDRKNLPAHFEERTRLCVRRIEDGSATAPLEVFMEAPPQGEFWDPEPVEVNEAIELAYDVFDCLGNDRLLPERFPKELVPEYGEWGRTLGPDEHVEFKPAARIRPASIDATSRSRLATFTEAPHASAFEVIGEVLEADVRQRRFQVWSDSDPKTPVSVVFDESQEGMVTQALKDHRSVRIRVRGRAEISPQGKPMRFTEVSSLELLPAGEAQYDASAPNIADEFARLAAEVPAEAWEQLPADFNEQLDHYLYDTPKK